MRILLLIIATYSFFSCKTTEKIPVGGEHIDVIEQVIEFSVIQNGTNSAYKTSENIEVLNLAGLDILWGKLFINYMKKPPIPLFDFETNMLLAVTMGERNSGGYTIKIKSIIESEKNIIVTIEETKPGTSCMTTSVMTYPFQLIEMPKNNKPLIYIRIEKIYECEK